MSIGKEDGQAEKYKKELAAWVKLLEDHEELEQAICNPLYGADDRKKVLSAVIERMGVSEVMTSFLSLLFDKVRIQYVTEIYRFYEKLTDELANIVRAELVAAVELPAEAVEKIRAALAKRTGKKVEMETKIDPGLIGGLVTRIGDLVLDGSVKTQLVSLKESLQRGEAI